MGKKEKVYLVYVFIIMFVIYQVIIVLPHEANVSRKCCIDPARLGCVSPRKRYRPLGCDSLASFVALHGPTRAHELTRTHEPARTHKRTGTHAYYLYSRAHVHKR